MTLWVTLSGANGDNNIFVGSDGPTAGLVQPSLVPVQVLLDLKMISRTFNEMAFVIDRQSVVAKNPCFEG